jgi:hypothetical protein
MRAPIHPGVLVGYEYSPYNRLRRFCSFLLANSKRAATCEHAGEIISMRPKVR